LEPFVSEAGVSDVFVNPDGMVWCDRGRGAELAEGIRIPAGEARDLAVRLIALGGRHVDEATPCVDVRLGAGVRVRELVLRRANLLITGAGGSGKTTLLGALLALAPSDERIVVIEDVAELQIAHPHVVALESRQPN